MNSDRAAAKQPDPRVLTAAKRQVRRWACAVTFERAGPLALDVAGVSAVALAQSQGQQHISQLVHRYLDTVAEDIARSVSDQDRGTRTDEAQEEVDGSDSEDWDTDPTYQFEWDSEDD